MRDLQRKFGRGPRLCRSARIQSADLARWNLMGSGQRWASCKELAFVRGTLCFVLLFAVTYFAQADGPGNLVVSVPVADMYSAAREDADVVSQAIYGGNLVVLEESSGWAKVRTPDQYSGWLNLNKVRRDSKNSFYATSANAVQVSSLLTNVYREPDVTAHRPLLAVPFESRFEVIAEGKGDDAGWLQVRLVDGSSAWVQAGDVSSDFRPLTINESLALARRFLGVTYTWGGRSSLGYDCSGFTQMVVRSRGIVMPRDADQQAVWQGAAAVDRKHLRAGDLLFFGNSVNQVTHTGMFIGHGQFIHDTTYGHPGVQISRLQDEPWTKLLIACRRITAHT
jgi:cell wall-associated NlpC family hydrolase